MTKLFHSISLIYNHQTTKICIALFILFFGLLLCTILSNMLKKAIHILFKKNKILENNIAKLNQSNFSNSIQLIFLGWFFIFGFSILTITSPIPNYITIIATILSYIGIISIGIKIANTIELFLTCKAKQTVTKYDDLLAPLISRTIKIIIFIVGIFSIAEILNLPITSLLTGLGIGGIAIAMAAKDTIANIFGSITILSDRPFNIGDWVKINDMEGTNEDLGFRSTKIRTFYNSLISVPNSLLLTASVDNLGERTYRRFNTKLSVIYSTPVDKIKAFNEGIKSLILEHPTTRKDYFLVHLNEFSSASLDILLYCFFF